MPMEYVRIIAYALITAACAFLAIEDHARRSFARWVWIALGFEHLAVLVLLAFDLQEVVVWMETRWMLTPFAIATAVFMVIYAYQRRVEHRRFQRVVEALFGRRVKSDSKADRGAR